MHESSSRASGDLCRLERAKINNKKHQMSPGDTATPLTLTVLQLKRETRK